MIKRLALAGGALVLAVALGVGYILVRHFVYWTPVEEVSFASGPIRLAGTFVKPDGDGVFPAMLLLHGSGPESRFDPPMRAVINALARHGIASLVYDKRGVGASGGYFESARYADFVDDAVAAVEYLSSRPDVDSRRIGLHPVSESGWFGPEIAARTRKVALIFNKVAAPLSVAETLTWEVRNDYLAAGIAESDVEALVELAVRRWTYYRDAAANPELAAGPEREAIEARLATLRETVPGAAEALPESLVPYDAERYAGIAADFFYDPFPFLLELDLPLYYAYGAHDINIPTRRSVQVLELLIREHGKDIEYKVYPGLGHGLVSWRGISQLGWPPGYLETLAAWTVEKMRARPNPA